MPEPPGNPGTPSGAEADPAPGGSSLGSVLAALARGLVSLLAGKLRLAEMELSRDLAGLKTTAILVFALVLLLVLALAFAGAGAALLLGEAMGSAALGLLAVAGIYLLAAFILDPGGAEAAEAPAPLPRRNQGGPQAGRGMAEEPSVSDPEIEACLSQIAGARERLGLVLSDVKKGRVLNPWTGGNGSGSIPWSAPWAPPPPGSSWRDPRALSRGRKGHRSWTTSPGPGSRRPSSLFLKTLL